MKKYLFVFICMLLTSNLFAAGSSSSSDRGSDRYRDAVSAVENGDYKTAIGLLSEVVSNKPNNADAWNYLGFSQRNEGQTEEAFTAYEKALALKPKHKGALEYQGELFLQTGQLDKAEENLLKLDKACLFSCEEMKDLENAIKAYKDKNTSG